MTTKGYVAIALAVWMTWTAFFAVPANALPNHVVAGGVLGPVPPGTQAGATNPANFANFAFYSVNDTANHPLLMGADTFTAADNTNPAFYYKDVGASWTWASGDNATAVVETIRGVNGWANTNVNYTTSLTGYLRSNPTTTDMGDATMQALPPLTLTGGAGYVVVDWTALTDAARNVASYHLYSAPSPGGAYTSVATVPHATGARSYNNTGLPPGMHCYELGVQYKRDRTGGVYETTGRSEPACATTTAAPPRIIATNPANGAANVAANVVPTVTFDMAINTATFAYNWAPVFATIVSWNTPTNTIATFNHPAGDFSVCTTYTLTITTAQNLGGTNLAPPNAVTFTTICPNPYVVSTVPLDGATGVRLTTTVQIQFSKAMNTGSVTVTFNPPVATNTCTSWNAPTNDLCSKTVALSSFTTYTVTVAGTDTLGNPLVAGPVANPFTFRSNTLPVATINAPITPGTCVTGGSDLDILWSMSDAETSSVNLRVWLNYTLGASTLQISGMQGVSGLTPPFGYTWTTPVVDGDIMVLLDVVDAAGDSGQDTSASVTIDSTAPTVTSTTPVDAATNVATDAAVMITFSEAMDAASTQAAISFVPTVASLTFTWAGLTVTVNHAAFTVNTSYTMTVGVGAHDDCVPGMPLASAQAVDFQTGAGPRAPNPPTNVRSTSHTDTAITISWDAPTTYTDGSPLPAANIASYTIYRATSLGGAKTQVSTVPGTTTTYADASLTADTTYYYWVTATDTVGTESAYSGPASQRTAAPAAGFPLWILILIIVVVALLIAGFLLMRRKPAEAPPSRDRSTARAPPREAAPEEEAVAEPAEQAGEGEGEKFIPCPNCGTMVKPTDAECFVCGTKL